MSEVQSPTETGADQDSSDIRDESQLEENQQDQSADYDESGNSSDEQEQSSEESQNESANDEKEEVDEALAKFAKSQGIEDLSELSKREKSLLKAAHDNRVAARSKKPSREIQEEINQSFSGDDSDTTRRLNQLEAKQKLSDFFIENPDAKDYEKEMAEVLQEERTQFGDDSARALAGNLPRLVREAKFRAGAYDSDAARESGRRDERESLRKRQEASADVGHASSSLQNASTKVTRDWIESSYDPTNPEHQKLVDDAISRGDLY